MGVMLTRKRAVFRVRSRAKMKSRPATWVLDIDTRALRHAEAHALQQLLSDRAGCTAVQIGGRGVSCLPTKRFLQTFHLDSGGVEVQVRARMDALPLMSEKVDLLLMIHAMDRHGTRNDWMAEAARVLRPEGRLVVVGRYLWPFAWLRWPKAPLGVWGLRALSARHDLTWESVYRLRPIRGVYVATMRRSMFGMTPLRLRWHRGDRTRRSLEVPGAGRAG